jgi:hypothetical protein
MRLCAESILYLSSIPDPQRKLSATTNTDFRTNHHPYFGYHSSTRTSMPVPSNPF